MTKLNSIQSLSIGVAEYFLEGKDSKIVMRLNYAENDFEFDVILNGSDLKEIIKEGKVIARHLLKDKARLNLIDRVRKKIQ